MIAAIPVIVTGLALVHPRHHFLWGQRLARTVIGRASPYRASARIDIDDVKEPASVRAAAVLTAFLGGMLVPGVIAAAAGGLACLFLLDRGHAFQNAENRTIFLVGLSAPSGLVISYRCLRLTRAMLENADGVTRRMRSLAVHSGVHNLLLVAVYVSFALTTSDDIEQVAWGTYPLVSLVHVTLLLVAARSIDRCRADNEELERALEEPGGAIAVRPRLDPAGEMPVSGPEHVSAMRPFP
ncbi:MAG: hypothetical protein R3F14_47795 [Polyangiaceae bacterium]